jgi:hypothetical protein
MREDNSSGYLSLLRLNRSQAFELLLVAVVLGVGVNLLANYLSTELSALETVIVGVVVTLVAAGLLLGRTLRPPPRVRRFNGFFLYDADENALARHDPRYELGYSLQRYLQAAFAENDSMKAVWDANPLSSRLGEDPGEASPDRDKSLDLIRQATEYFLLRSFSKRLSDHFASGDYSGDDLETYSHADLPQFLLENKFFRTFAEPMEERAAFLPDVPGSPKWRVVSATSPEGAMYERFELVLPKGWGVTRSAGNKMEIQTARFALTIEIESEGWGELLPETYVPYYLGLEVDPEHPDERYTAMSIGVSITIAARRTWPLSRMVWKDYRWIDRWIADLHPQISTDAYLEKIGYALAETGFLLMLALPAPRDEPATDSPAVFEEPAEVPRPTRSTHPFKTGDRVEHASFGEGTVTGDEPGGVVIVTFDGESTSRKLMADYAPMRPL